ncbi:MAG: AraC family transcriptional regulator [Neptuniibacter sp.]
MSELSQLLSRSRDHFGQGQSNGFVETSIPGVRLFWSDHPVARSPMLYEAGIIIIGQGHKIGRIDGKSFRYDSGHYLVVSAPTPAECESFATVDDPLLGIFIDVDLSDLQLLVAKVSKYSTFSHDSESKLYSNIEPVQLDHDMEDTAIRLLKAMLSPLEGEALGTNLVQEIMFRALQGERGSALYTLTQHNSHYARIAKALSHVHKNFKSPIRVEDLSESSNMSVSVFHRTFKKITGETPLQYLKKTRLNKAKDLIVDNGLRAGVAASEVGYESVSQFSREFKRYFGKAPTDMYSLKQK